MVGRFGPGKLGPLGLERGAQNLGMVPQRVVVELSPDQLVEETAFVDVFERRCHSLTPNLTDGQHPKLQILWIL